MLAHLGLTCALAILMLLSFVNSAEQPARELFVDADLFDAVDDTAALLLACTLPNTNLLAVNINVNSTYSALAASAIVNHYGYPSVPIGLPRPYMNITSSEPFGNEYASRVAAEWSGGSVPWFEVNKTWDPVELYRKTLAEAKNRSVTIVSIGFMGSISGLLNTTADMYSSLDGYGLVRAKVKELVVMGGGYLPQPSLDEEYNFSRQEAPHVVNTWPDEVPMTFLGSEVGVQVLTGARLTVCGPPDDPVKTAFQWWGGYNISQYSWDHLTMAYAGRGLGNWFEYGNANGYNYLYPNGTNIWVEDERKTSQHYLRLKASNITVAKELDNLLLRGSWTHAQVD
ncbi:inosine uridine-preferring nucleoside hydrolase protein [Stemphylium lycopersici]|uniref:Inosine uridine-preferring nucleoside hydrolase protein n=1 Tax=Stemphylium lycopersici TaxID=183478 RepID=A0A364MTS7_STELY|nr:inosine uridine-preferring nucleoside hydrolase protein [Stemphylium lycopersici]